MQNKVYEYVTERILKKLESGVIPWRRPWGAQQRAINWVSQKPYSGINAMLLEPGEYVTFKQALECKAHVKKGAKASMIVFYRRYEKENDDGEKSQMFVLRYYNVFELADVEGLERRCKPTGNETGDDTSEAERIAFEFSASGKCPVVNCSSQKACYMPTIDVVNIPDVAMFNVRSEYYATLFHELAHSTGRWTRLHRYDENDRHEFGSETYSKEELVAEMAAAFLCSMSGIASERLMDNQASYVSGWKNRISGDNSLVIKAASLASKASDYIALIDSKETIECREVEPC